MEQDERQPLTNIYLKGVPAEPAGDPVLNANQFRRRGNEYRKKYRREHFQYQRSNRIFHKKGTEKHGAKENKFHAAA